MDRMFRCLLTVSEMSKSIFRPVEKEKLWISFFLLTLFGSMPREPLRNSAKTLLHSGWPGSPQMDSVGEVAGGRGAWQGRWIGTETSHPAWRRLSLRASCREPEMAWSPTYRRWLPQEECGAHLQERALTLPHRSLSFHQAPGRLPWQITVAGVLEMRGCPGARAGRALFQMQVTQE